MPANSKLMASAKSSWGALKWILPFKKVHYQVLAIPFSKLLSVSVKCQKTLMSAVILRNTKKSQYHFDSLTQYTVYSQVMPSLKI